MIKNAEDEESQTSKILAEQSKSAEEKSERQAQE